MSAKDLSPALYPRLVLVGEIKIRRSTHPPRICGVATFSFLGRHGARRTNADRRHAIEIVLRDPEWSGRSTCWIATVADVTDKTVTAMRNMLTGSASEIPKCTTVKT